MEVYLTGSTGFLGKNLIGHLSDSTFLLRFLGRDELNDTFNIQFASDSSIVHLAGKAHDIKNISLPDGYYDTNFNLTKRLYDDFLKSKAKKFIFISSVKASADSVEGTLTESDVPDPQTHYGKSKRMAEEYIQSQPLPEGKSFYILRPCMIHGPGNKGNLNLLYKLISKGLPYLLGAFENKRSFLSVENLCFVIRELLERDDIPSGIYNVADDEALSTSDLIKLIAKSQNKSPKVLNISKTLIKIVAKLGDKLHLPLNSERLQKLTESYVVSNVKIKQALGKVLPVSSKDGLIKTFESFSSHA